MSAQYYGVVNPGVPTLLHSVTVNIRYTVCLLLFMCLVYQSGEANADDDTLIIINSVPPTTIDPHLGVTGQDAIVTSTLFCNLYERVSSFELQPILSKSKAISEDGKIYTFVLKPNLFWSDGVPLTAHDVVFSLKRLAMKLQKKEVGSRALFDKVVGFKDAVEGGGSIEDIGVSALNSSTVVYQLNSPDYMFLQRLADFTAVVLPKHAIEKYGDNWTDTDNLVSSGPYVVENNDLPLSIGFAKNPLYLRADEHRQKKAVMHFGSQEKSSMRLAQELNADFIMSLGADALKLASQLFPDSTVRLPTSGIERIKFNLKKEKLKDVRTRKAIVLALDIDHAIEQSSIIANKANFLIPGNYEPMHRETELSIEKRRVLARELLAQAGYTKENPLEITVASYEIRNKRDYVRYLISDLKKIGIVVKTDLHDTYNTLSESFYKNNFDVSIAGWGGPPGDIAYFLTPFRESSGYSLLNLNDESIEAAIENVFNAVTNEDVFALSNGVMSEIIEQYYAYPILSPAVVSVMHPQVKVQAESGAIMNLKYLWKQ